MRHSASDQAGQRSRAHWRSVARLGVVPGDRAYFIEPGSLRRNNCIERSTGLAVGGDSTSMRSRLSTRRMRPRRRGCRISTSVVRIRVSAARRRRGSLPRPADGIATAAAVWFMRVREASLPARSFRPSMSCAPSAARRRLERGVAGIMVSCFRRSFRVSPTGIAIRPSVEERLAGRKAAPFRFAAFRPANKQ